MISSAFDKVLRELADSQEASPRCRPSVGGIKGSVLLGGWSKCETANGAKPRFSATDAYLQEFNSKPRERAAVNNRMTLDDLRARIRRGLTKQQIAKLRRDFARQHHPDCARAPDRELSADLMAQANDLLDGAVWGAEGNS
ncbi:MAG: hypothetical protein AAF346_11395 [Pseudomonadota bacterium]